MSKKFYLSSVAAVALLSACSSDELVPQQAEEVTDVLANRPKIEVTLGIDDASTRMMAGGDDNKKVKFDITDQLGAVLVDKGLSTPANYFDLVTTNTHIGNNRFYYKDPKFVTDGVMAVGSWLFYTPYNAENTKRRDGIKFDLPLIQEYAKDYTELVKEGKEWRFSPIVNLVGQENGYFNFNIPTISAYTYAKVNLTFPQNVTVQKLVLKPSGQIDGTTYDAFAHTYELYMGNGTDGLSAARADLEHVRYAGDATPYPYRSNEELVSYMRAKLAAKNSYIKAITQSGTAVEQLIALNCLDSELTASKTFESYMLIPSGQYTCIRLYAYTDKGVYVYNINDECEAAPTTGRDASLATADNGQITLKREGAVSLHNIAGYTSAGNSAFAALQVKAIQMTETKDIIDLQASTETDGSVVISQKDLIAVIQGITRSGLMKVRVLGDDVKITKEVADAIVAKENVVGDIQIQFDRHVNIEGTTEGYDLADVTLAGNATLTKGKVNIGADVHIPAGNKLTVNGGTTLDVKTVATNVPGTVYTYNEIDNNGTLNVDATGVEIGTVVSDGEMNVKKNAEITTLTNNKNVTVETDVTLKTAFTNNASVSQNELFSNKGVIDIVGNSYNNGNFTNEGTVNVIASNLENFGTITNIAGAKIISGENRPTTAAIINKGTIDNAGFLYCFNGNNTITNLGTINARTSSTTYITCNSSTDESNTTTGGTKSYTGTVKNVTMGVINLDNRDEDVSVTTVAQKGYIVWTTAENSITYKSGDKFNKVILTEVATVDDDRVRYIETTENLTIKNQYVQELTFNNSVTLKTTSATVGYLEIAANQVVKLPTENKIAIEDVTFNTPVKSWTKAQINNKGTLLVGGDLYSSAIQTCPVDGIFASGDGNTTAFHWNTPKP